MQLIEGEDLAVRVRSKPLEERSQTELLDQIDAVVRICGLLSASRTSVRRYQPQQPRQSYGFSTILMQPSCFLLKMS